MRQSAVCNDSADSETQLVSGHKPCAYRVVAPPWVDCIQATPFIHLRMHCSHNKFAVSLMTTASACIGVKVLQFDGPGTVNIPVTE